MKNFLLTLGFISTAFGVASASAMPACKVTVVLSSDSSTSKTSELRVQNPSVDPVVMLAEINHVSCAVFYHRTLDTLDISITPNVTEGTFARGLKVGPAGLSIIHDSAMDYTAKLDCGP
jgi:hypothetical protein